jgi:hypothetical protein
VRLYRRRIHLARRGDILEDVSTKRTPSKDLPPDVAAGQIWREGEQHFHVESVHKDTATRQRCSPAGTVLNPRYRITRTGDQMRAAFVLVRDV